MNVDKKTKQQNVLLRVKCWTQKNASRNTLNEKGDNKIIDVYFGSFWNIGKTFVFFSMSIARQLLHMEVRQSMVKFLEAVKCNNLRTSAGVNSVVLN